MKKKRNPILTAVLIVAIVMAYIPTSVYAALYNTGLEFFSKYDSLNEEQIYSSRVEVDRDELISEIIMLEENLPGMDDKIAMLPHLTALIDKAKEFSEEELINLIRETKTGIGLDSALIKMYIKNEYDSANLLELLHEDISVEAKEYIVATGKFSSESLADIFKQNDGHIAVIAMKRIAVDNEKLAYELSEPILSGNTQRQNPQKCIAAILGTTRFYELNPTLISEKSEFIHKLRDIYFNSGNELLQDQAVYAMARISDFEAFSYIVTSDEIDLDLKVSTIERNVKLMRNIVSGSPSDKEIDVVIQAMKLHPILDVGSELVAAIKNGTLKENPDIINTIKFIEKNGIEGVDKYEEIY